MVPLLPVLPMPMFRLPRVIVFALLSLVAVLWVVPHANDERSERVATVSRLRTLDIQRAPGEAAGSPEWHHGRIAADAKDDVIAMIERVTHTQVILPDDVMRSGYSIAEMVCLPPWEDGQTFRCQGVERGLNSQEITALALAGNPFAAAYWLDSVEFERDGSLDAVAQQIMLKRVTLGDVAMLDNMARLALLRKASGDDESTAVALRYAAWVSGFHGDADYDVREGAQSLSYRDCEKALWRGVAIAAWFGWDGSERARALPNGIATSKCLVSSSITAQARRIGQIDDHL